MMLTVHGSFRSIIAAALALLATYNCADAAETIIAQYPLASIEAGRDPASSARILEQMVVAVTLPALAEGTSFWEENQILDCTRVSLGNWALQDTQALDGSLSLDGEQTLPRIDHTVDDLAREIDVDDPATTLTPALFTRERTNRIAKTDEWIRKQTAVVRERLKIECNKDHPTKLISDNALSKMRLLLSMRRCESPTPGKLYHPCNLRGLVGTSPIPARDAAYSQLYFWLTSQGDRPRDQWFDLSRNAPGQIVPVTKTLTSLDDSIEWKPTAPGDIAKQFEAQVNYLHSTAANNKKLSSALLHITALSQANATRILDLIDSPVQTISSLPTTGQVVLESLSDEVARSRLTNCMQLGGLSANNMQQLSECSGYTLKDTDVTNCINGLRCFPDVSQNSFLSAGVITDQLSIEQLVKQTLFPRIGNNKEWAQWKEISRGCASASSPQAATDNDYQIGAVNCTMEKTLSGQEFDTYKCARDAKDTKTLMGCIPMGGTAKITQTCISENNGNTKALMACIGKESLPGNVRSCVDKFASSDSTRDALQVCLTEQLVGDPRLAQIAQCAKDKTEAADIALCAASPYLPADAQKMVSCATQSSSWSGFAGCSLKDDLQKRLGGDLGNAVRCGIQAGGDPVGTGVCLAGGNLNPTQQIVMQCAAASGGEPMTFATCAGGQLALKEFAQCKDVKFAEDKCFGENNEIRKLSRALGLGDIGPNSAVAKIANAHLDVLKAQVRLAEDAFKDLTLIADDASKAVGELFQGIEHFGNELANAVGQLGDGLGHAYNEVRNFVSHIFGW